MSPVFYFSVLVYLLSPFCTAQEGSASVGDGGVRVELWCVAKNNAEDAAIQTAIDWACGPGGADCGPIQPGGPCHDASDIQRTATFAFNNYFIRNGMTNDSCDFQNTAALTSLNPSFGNCKIPSSLSKPISIVVGTTQADVYSSSCIQVGRWMWDLVTVSLLFVPLFIF
ncbi:unnamed protein product [Cuscuta europaea]|uniref:X8 domain-containing protein n=1 Tax=Cuscuta europaea TaxID=41803 RepID=A0A9P1ELZ2_CUSEU|nr:unnamed protein product [Cuscuta europaea]